MVERGGLACGDEGGAGLRDDGIVFGMDADQRAISAGEGENLQDFGIV